MESRILMETAEKLLQAVANEEKDTISDDMLSALNSVFPFNLLQALNLLDQDSVTKYVCTTSRRELYQVLGDRKNHYFCFASSLYCSCPSFVYNTLIKGEALMCKHQLAMRLAVALGRTRTIEVDGREWAQLAESDGTPIPDYCS